MPAPPLPAASPSSSAYALYAAPPPYHRCPAPAYDAHDHDLQRPQRPLSTCAPSPPPRTDPAPPGADRDRKPHASAAPRRADRIHAQAIAGLLRPSKKPHPPPAAPSARAAALHPLLGMRPPPLLFDVRWPESHMRVSRTWAARGAAEPATSPPCAALRLVFADGPWTVDVVPAAGAASAVTCADVFRALRAALAQPLGDVEWALADAGRRRAIVKANLRRTGDACVRAVRRVDWLGKRTLFAGMRAAERRWLPADEPAGPVFEVRFVEPSNDS